MGGAQRDSWQSICMTTFCVQKLVFNSTLDCT